LKNRVHSRLSPHSRIPKVTAAMARWGCRIRAMSTKQRTRSGARPGGKNRNEARMHRLEKWCPNQCGSGIAERQDSVSPQDVKMTDADIASARLHDHGELFRCRHCGCVWERYRDELGERAKRKIGTFEGPGPEVGFVPFRDPYYFAHRMSNS
jgi:hypothetical protein